MATTVTTKCKRCNGTGVWMGRGECFGCNMAGVRTHIRYTATEKAEKDARQARVSAVRNAIWSWAEANLSKLDRWDAQDGYIALRDREPERFEKLLASVEAGRLEDVVRALVAYRNNE